MAEVFTIREAAERSGLPADTIRYYEREGVLPSPPRTSSGYRLYREEHVQALALARRLRELGLGLREIRAVVAAFHDGECGQLRDELLRLVRSARERLARRREELERTDEALRALEDGLDRVEPRDTRLATVTPCPCVRLALGSADLSAPSAKRAGRLPGRNG